MRSLEILVALILTGCIPDEGPLMDPGQNCMRMACHHPGAEAKAWTVGGTVYGAADAEVNAGVSGVRVRVTDATGWTFSLRSNQSGNFYSAEPVTYPLTLCLERSGSSLCMQATDSGGSCNTCHTLPPSGGAASRLYAP